MSAETNELRSLTDAQLETQLLETYQELFNLRFQTATRQLADVAQVANARRRIARIKTLQRERKLIEEIDAQLASQNGN